MRKRGRGAPAVVSLLLLAACEPSPDAPPTRPWSAQAPAATLPRIVSVDPCSDAILAETSAPGQLLAISHYSQERASSSMDVETARTMRATGGTLEEIAALEPDLVVANVYLPPATAQGLQQLGIRVETVPMATTVAQSVEQVRRLSKLSGNRAAGEAMVARIDAAMRRAAPASDRAPVSALVWESGGIVAGQGTLIDDLLVHAGFANDAAERGLRQADYLPLESVLADPPQVILAVGDDVSEADRSLRHPALDALTGTRRAALDSSLLWCGGPTIPRALDRLAHVRAQVSS